MFLIVSIVVPVMVYTLAWRWAPSLRWRWLLMIACALFIISWWLPSPLIDGHQTEFMTHLVGGGMFTGMLWMYLKYAKSWRAAWWIEVASLFALVSTLGVANELFEFVLYEVGYMRTIADTSYDLVANTLGALLVFVVYLAWSRLRGHARD